MKNPNRFDTNRLRLDHTIARFFAANAVIAVVVLGLITLFLFREGAGFFRQNLESLRLYRQAGLEYVDLMRSEVEGHTALNRVLQEVRLRQFRLFLDKGESLDAANAQLAEFDRFATAFDNAGNEVRSITSDLSDAVMAIKEKARIQEDAVVQKAFLLQAGRTEEAEKVSITPVDFAKELEPVKAAYPAFQAASRGFRREAEALLTAPPKLPDPGAEARLERFGKAARAYFAGFPEVERQLESWDQNRPVPWTHSVTSFLFGKRWITNSFWQDFYGVLPLLSGSLLVALVAMAVAVPLGVCGAIYVSEIATPAEQHFIKPYIEFISAIPSVVLGFFGIAVLGEAIRAASGWAWLEAIVPAFPISERLNAFTAGTLLALMAVPTIFSLAEDALTSVPRAFKEASYALGATRFQTIFRILIPAAFSGIISAVLLGFGRVIGETMVVLLCAGNRIAIPDFMGGVATLFEPVHTMTGIVAQEMGEVVRGSVQYRALFMVGLLLFFISLSVNWLAQAAVRRFKTSIG